MKKIQTSFDLLHALAFALLCAAAASALATPTRGSQFNNWCAKQPVQPTPPQQSRPYQAAGSTCSVCHTSGSPSNNDLNAKGVASASCSGSGTATTCGTAMNPHCIATAPSNATITAPAAGTSVTQGSSLTFSAGNATNPDGFPLAYDWSFSSGQPAVSGQSVAVPMTVTGAVTATLQVRNSVGMLASGTVPTRSVNVTGGNTNQAPAASIVAPAASVAITPGASVSFQGSGSDPDGNTPLSYSWSFPGGSPASSTAQNPGAVSYASAGSYTASLTVRDSLGLASTTVTRSISVAATANQAPTASITAPTAGVSIAAGASVSFQGSGSDPDGNTPLSYSWSFPGGSPASSTAQNPGAVTYAAAGSYTASLTVRDSLGLASTTVTRSISVSGTPGANLPPLASIVAPAADLTIGRGATVFYQGAGSDPDNHTPLRYRWTFPGGNPASSTAQNPGAVSYASAGTYTTSLVVSDSQGLAATAVTRTITVAAVSPPTASISSPSANLSIVQGRTVSFAGSGSVGSDSRLPLSYSWTFPGGTPASSTLRSPGAVVFDQVGVHTVSFRVTDRNGVSSSTRTRTITVTPAPQPPVASIVAPTGNVTINQGQKVSFQGAASDPDNSLPLTWSWSFPGGTPATSTAQNPGPVSYNRAGEFVATLVVRDRSGLASPPVTRSIAVQAVKPVATIVAPAMNLSLLPGGSFSFRGAGSGFALPLSYRWTFTGASISSSSVQNPGAVRFSSPGNHTATLTVTDASGSRSETVTRTITVAAANQAVSAVGQCSSDDDDEHDDERDDD